MIELKGSTDIVQLQKRLDRLQKTLQTKVVHSSLVSAVKPIKTSMKQLLPEASGDLRKAVSYKKISASGRQRVSQIKGDDGRSAFSVTEGHAALLIGPNRRVNGLHQAYKAQFLEFGTKPHALSPRAGGEKKALSFGGEGAAAHAMHPGIKAGGFMRQALALNEHALADRFYTAMAKKLDKERA